MDTETARGEASGRDIETLAPETITFDRHGRISVPGGKGRKSGGTATGGDERWRPYVKGLCAAIIREELGKRYGAR